MSVLRDYIKIKSSDSGTKKFKWTSITDSFGKRLDIKQINYIDTPLIQYFGESLRSFDVNIITGAKAPSGKSAYRRDKNWLNEFFNTEKSKIFHLTFPDGKTKRCVFNNGTITESSNSTGQLTVSFKCTYYPIPKVKSDAPDKGKLPEWVQDLQRTITDTADDFFKNEKVIGFNKFLTSLPQTADTVADFVEKVQDKLSTLEELGSDVVGLFQQPSEWVSSLLEINSSVRSLASTPQTLYATIISTVSQVGVYFGDTASTFDAVANTFTFQKAESKTYTNAQEYYKQSNEDGNNAIFNSLAFISLISIASGIEYKNSEEVDKVQNSLDETYRFLISDITLPNEVRQSLFEAKIAADEYLNSIRLNINSVILVDITRIQPFDKIVFDRYGSLDLYNELLALNSSIVTDINNVSGEIKLYAI